MGIPEEIDIELSLQQAIQLAQEQLLPEAEHICKLTQKSKRLLNIQANTRKQNFPVTVSQLFRLEKHNK